MNYKNKDDNDSVSSKHPSSFTVSSRGEDDGGIMTTELGARDVLLGRGKRRPQLWFVSLIAFRGFFRLSVQEQANTIGRVHAEHDHDATTRSQGGLLGLSPCNAQAP